MTAQRGPSRWPLVAAPPERLAGLRVVVTAFAVVDLAARAGYLLDSAKLPRYRWQPVGLAGLLSGPPSRVAVVATLLVTLAAGLAAVVGWRWRLAGPVLAVGTLALATYGVSFGHILHTEHLVVLHLAVLAVSPASAAWSLDARRRRADAASASPAAPPQAVAGENGRHEAARYGFPLVLISVITVSAYAVAGWAKLRNGGWEWVAGDVLRFHVAHDNLRKAVLGDHWSRLGGALVGQRWLWPPVGVATVLIELGAPLALLRRRLGYGWAVAAWCFHVGTLAVMAILFPYPLSGAAFASFFPLERGARGLAAWAGRASATIGGQRNRSREESRNTEAIVASSSGTTS